MGDWAIVVHGTGAHHNKDYPTDADRMAQEFVDKLIEAGHTVALATFTSGGRTVLDVTENLEAKHRSSDYYRTPENSEALAASIERRRESLSFIGLNQSPRKDPVGGPAMAPRLATTRDG